MLQSLALRCSFEGLLKHRPPKLSHLPLLKGLPEDALPPGLAVRAGREPDDVSLVWKARRLQVGTRGSAGSRSGWLPGRLTEWWPSSCLLGSCVQHRCRQVKPHWGWHLRLAPLSCNRPLPCPATDPPGLALQALVIQDWPMLAPNVTAALKKFECVSGGGASPEWP